MPQDAETRGFLIHAAAYAAVNAALIVVNLWRTPEALWFVWPLLGWGIGLAAHGLALYWRRHGRGRLADPEARGFAVHAFVYAAVNVLLIVVDLTTSPGAQWFYWPLLAWGVGLAAHGYGVRRSLLAAGPGVEGDSRT